MTFRLSLVEKAMLQDRASLAGLSVSAFLLGMALGDKMGEEICNRIEDCKDMFKDLDDYVGGLNEEEEKEDCQTAETVPTAT